MTFISILGVYVCVNTAVFTVAKLKDVVNGIVWCSWEVYNTLHTSYPQSLIGTCDFHKECSLTAVSGMCGVGFLATVSCLSVLKNNRDIVFMYGRV